MNTLTNTSVRSKHRRASRILASSIAALLVGIHTAPAALITMTGTDSSGSSSFNAGTNWPGAAAPTTGNTYSTGNFSMRTPAGLATSTFLGDSLTLASGGALLIKSSSGGTTVINNLILNGGTVNEAIGANATATLAGTTITVTATSGFDGGAGAGDIRTTTVSGNLAGNAGLFVGNTGLGTVILGLSGSNSSFGGSMAVNAGGGLVVNGASSLGTGQFTVNAGGYLSFGYAALSVQTLLNTQVDTASMGVLALTSSNTLSENLNFTNFANLFLGTAGTVTYTGSLTPAGGTYRLGGGGGTLTYQSALTGTNALLVNGNVTLTGTNTSTGGVTVNSGTLKLDFTAGTAPTTNLLYNGVTAGAVTLGGFAADVAGGNAYAVNTPTINLTGKASTNNSQTFGGLTLNQGNDVLTATPGATGGGMLVTLGAITHNLGGMVTFTLPAATPSATNAITTTSTNVNGILGGWARVGTSWAAVSGSQIVAYTGYTTLSGAAPIVASAAASNVLASSGSTGNITVSTAGTTDINTLQISDTAARTVDIQAGNTLRLGPTGAVYRSDLTTTTGVTIGTAVGTGTITAGGAAANNPGELVFIADASGTVSNTAAITVNSIIANNGTGAVSVVKAGNNTLILAAANTFTGGVYVNSGRLAVTGSGALNTTSPVAVTVQPGAQVFIQPSSTFANNFNIAGRGTTESSAYGSLRLGGATLSGTITLLGDASIGATGGTSTLSGQITGTYGLELTDSASAIFILSNTTNNFSGNLGLNGNYGGAALTLKLGNVNVVPNGVGKGNVVLTGTATAATLVQLDLNGNNQAINGLSSTLYSGQTRITNNASGTGTATLTLGSGNASASYGGNIVDGTTAHVALAKTGTGTQVLAGTNSYTGGTQVNAGALSFLTTASQPSSGTVTVAAGATLGLGIAGAGSFTAANVDSLFANTLTNVSMSATSLVGIDTTAGSFTYASSVPSTTLGLNKLAAGALTLSGTNAYAGVTTVSAGTLQVVNEASLYNNTPASWTAANIIVSPGATVAFNVGGANQFTPTDVTTLLTNLGGLGGAVNNNGFGAGSTLAFDTTNAAGGTFTVSNNIANSTGTGGGAIALTKLGAGNLTLSGTPTYTGTTTVSAGTLQLAGNAPLFSSTVTIAAGATLNYNNTSGLTQGAPTSSGLILAGGGTLAKYGAGTLTFANATGPVNWNLSAGALIDVEAGTLNGGSNNNDVWTNNKASLNIAAGANFNGIEASVIVDALTGAGTYGAGYFGPRTLTIGINNGSGTFSGAIIGVSSGTPQILKVGTGTETLTGSLNFGGNYGSTTVQVSGGTTLSPSTLTIAPTGASTYGYNGGPMNVAAAANDVAILNQSAGTAVASSMNIATNGGVGTYNLSGSGILNTNSIQVATNGSSGTVAGTITVAGTAQANLFSNGSIVMGQYYGRLATVTQSGGSVVFYSDAGVTRGGTGSLAFNGGNTASVYNLNGGTLSLPKITWAASGGGAGGGNGILNFNGGTLQITSSAFTVPTTISNGNPAVTTGVLAGGAIIDTYGLAINFNSVLAHGAGSPDGGLTLNDSKVSPGTLTLSAANTYTGNTVITNGTLALAGTGSINASPFINVGSAGVFNVSGVTNYSPASGQILGGLGTVAGALVPTTGVITGATAGTGGTLNFSNLLTLAGATVRFDLDTTSASANNDKIEANGGLNASAGSALNLVFAALPTTQQTYRLFDYTGATLSSTAQGFLSLSTTGSVSGVGARNLTLDFSTAGQVNLTFTPGSSTPANLIWASTGSNVWAAGFNGPVNWNNTTAGAPANDRFYGGDSVTLDDTAGVVTAISLSVAAAPTSFTVSSTAAGNNFSIGGSGKITGATGLTKTGNSTLTIGTSNDFTGTTSIGAGTVIALNAGGSATGVTSTTIASGAILQIGDNATAGAGNVSGSVVNNGTLILNRPDASTFAASVSGAAFIQNGAGTTTLGAVNTYTGSTSVNSGGLTLGVLNALPSTTNVGLATGTTLNLNGFAQTLVSITGVGNSSLALGAGSLTLNTGASALSGVITGTSASSITLTGTASLSVANTVGTGTINVAPANSDNSALSIGAGASLTLTNLKVAAGAGAGGTGSVTQSGGTVTVTNMTLADGSATAAVASYTLSGGSLDVTGGLQMSNNNNSNSTLGISGAGTHLNFYNNSTLTLGNYYGMPATITQGAGTLVAFYSNSGATLGGSGGFYVNGGHAYVYNLNGGTLSTPKFAFGGQASNYAPAMAMPVFNFNGGVLQAAASSSDFFGTGTSSVGSKWVPTIQTGGGTIDTHGNSVTITNAIIHDATLGGTPDGGLTLNDSAATPGTLTLSGTDTYTGPSTIASGTLRLGSSGALPLNTLAGGAGLAISSGGTLDLNSQSIMLAAAPFGSGGTITNAAASGNSTLTISGGGTMVQALTDSSATTPGTGTLALTVTGGTLALSNINTYAGATTISGGTLQIDGSIAAASNVAVGTSGTLSGTGVVNGNTTLTGNGIVNFGIGGSIAGTLSISGGKWNGAGSVSGLVTSSSGSFKIGSGANLTANGGLNVTGGSLSGTDATSTITGSINYTSAVNSTFVGVIAGSGAALNLNNSAVTLFLSGANTYSGGTTISAGTLQIGSATALGANGGAVSVSAGAVLDLNGTAMTATNALTLAGTGIDGSGALTNSDGAAGTYSGAVTLITNSGIGGAGDITLAGTVNLAGKQLTVNNSGTVNLNGALSANDGTLDTEGTGTTNVNAAIGIGNSAVYANATTNFTTSQTLASLNIGFAAPLAGSGVSSAMVPEPGSLGLLLVSALGFASARRQRQRRK